MDEYALLADIFNAVAANTDDGAIDVGNKCGKYCEPGGNADAGLPICKRPPAATMTMFYV